MKLSFLNLLKFLFVGAGILFSATVVKAQCFSVQEDTIRGTVFSDFNQDGVFNGTDTSLPGIRVYLYRDLNKDSILDPTDVLIDSVNSAINGSYELIFNPASRDASVSSQISFNDDDAEELSSTMILNDIDLDFGENDHIGLRFRNINIPKGTVITAARLEFTAEEAEGGSSTLNIYVHDTSNSTIFTSVNNNISSRAKTTSSVTWSTPNWQVDSVYSTPDLSAPLQELFDRTDWAANNTLSMIIESSGQDRVMYAYEGNASKAPRLYIDYIEFDTSDNYLVVINENDVGVFSDYSTDSLHAAFFDCGGQLESGKDFGLFYSSSPATLNDYDTTTANTSFAIDVLANDTDNENNLDPGSVDTVGLLQPSNGTITNIDPVNGEITYQPDLNFIGNDTFSYSVCDSTMLCDTALVFINVKYHNSEVDCGNSFDDDNDGNTDCADSDCVPSPPGSITPSGNVVCTNKVGETYSITAIAGAVSYTWTVPVGATITSGQGSISITADWGSNPGDVCVTYNDGFCESPQTCVSIDMIFEPAMPVSIIRK